MKSDIHPIDTHQSPSIEKMYESFMSGENVCLILYRRRDLYGVVTLYKNTAVSQDYVHSEPETNILSTFKGNEESIIDWVPLDLANRRFTNLMMKRIYMECGLPDNGGVKNAPHLMLVQKDE